MNMGEDEEAPSLYKGLHVGESGTGKTGSLASLVKAGYRLWVIDADAGLGSHNPLRDALKGDKEALSRVTYEIFRDQIGPGPKGHPVIKRADAYARVGTVIKEWGVENFTSRDIVVVDTLTSLSSIAFNQALALGSRLNQAPQQQDYGWMAKSIDVMIQWLTDPAQCPCHFIVNTHVRFLGAEEDDGVLKGLPNAKGQEISRTVAGYFNTILYYRTSGSGAATKRSIITQPQGVVQVKAAGLTLKPTYPVESGLADIFNEILGHRGPSQDTPKWTVGS